MKNKQGEREKERERDEKIKAIKQLEHNFLTVQANSKMCQLYRDRIQCFCWHSPLLLLLLTRI